MGRELKLSRYVSLAVGGSTDLRPTISIKFRRAAACHIFGVFLSLDLPLHGLDLLQRWYADLFHLSLVVMPAGFEELVLVLVHALSIGDHARGRKGGGAYRGMFPGPISTSDSRTVASAGIAAIADLACSSCGNVAASSNNTSKPRTPCAFAGVIHCIRPSENSARTA